MPRKDPMTGCSVITLPEFLADEAQREGKGRSGGEILADIYAEIDADSRRQEAELRKPANALEAVKRAVADTQDPDEPALPEIIEVLQVLEVHYEQSYSGFGESLKAEARGADGNVYFVDYRRYETFGSRWEPPDGDVELSIGKFERTTRRPWKCYRCGRERAKGERNWVHVKQSGDSKMAVHACPRCNGWDRQHRH